MRICNWIKENVHIDLPARMRNPWFWVGVGSVALTAIGVDPMTFTSWGAVWDGIKSVASNPVQLTTMCLAILSVFVDPSTSGITDKKIPLSQIAEVSNDNK